MRKYTNVFREEASSSAPDHDFCFPLPVSQSIVYWSNTGYNNETLHITPQECLDCILKAILVEGVCKVSLMKVKHILLAEACKSAWLWVQQCNVSLRCVFPTELRASAYHSTLMKERAKTRTRCTFYLQNTLWLPRLLHRQ